MRRFRGMLVRTPVRPTALLLLLAACGTKHVVATDAPGGGGGDDDAAVDADESDASADARPDSSTTVDAAIDAPTIDAFPAVVDLHINCRNDCVLIANPSSIAVAAGTSFQVNWINTGDTDCDVAKIDQFNQVPIIIGLEPGTSYHDPVHDWCGQFTGTFDFRISICTLPSYIPVNCGA